MGGRTFDCLDAVINRYRTEQIVEGTEFYRVLPSFTEFYRVSAGPANFFDFGV